MDIPDEVRNAAHCWAAETGRFPQWYLDLLAGTHSGGHVPSVSLEGIAEYRAAIRRRPEVAALHRRLDQQRRALQRSNAEATAIGLAALAACGYREA